MKMKKGILRVALASALLACLCIAPVPTASASYRSGHASFTLSGLGVESYHLIYAYETASETYVFTYVHLSVEWWWLQLAAASSEAKDGQAGNLLLLSSVQARSGHDAEDMDYLFSIRHYPQVWAWGVLWTWDWIGTPPVPTYHFERIY